LLHIVSFDCLEGLDIMIFTSSVLVIIYVLSLFRKVKLFLLIIYYSWDNRKNKIVQFEQHKMTLLKIKYIQII